MDPDHLKHGKSIYDGLMHKNDISYFELSMLNYQDLWKNIFGAFGSTLVVGVL